MTFRAFFLTGVALVAIFLQSLAYAAETPAISLSAPKMEKRWLFFWQDMANPDQVRAMIARFPTAKASGCNGVVFPCNVAPAVAPELIQAAQSNSLGLIPVVMGGSHDRNYAEGVPVKDAVFVVHQGRAVLEPDATARLRNADFEEVDGNHFKGWGFQDDDGVTSFADHAVVHGGKTSLRMESIGKNQAHHCRLAQPLALRPFRQYRLSFWVKTENLTPADAEVKVLSPDTSQTVSFQTFHVEPTQDWKHYDLIFNSFAYEKSTLYLGAWSGNSGKLWWDDLSIEEVGLINVLRRPGCPVVVRGENGVNYDEGRDYERIDDPLLNPWSAYHESPAIKLTPSTHIPEGARLFVSYYHPVLVYEDRVTSCLAEPKIFDDWEAEVKQTRDLLHPAAYLMSHDELRVMNQCALCRAKNMTPGQLLAWNVHRAAAIIRKIQPGAEIWVWSDMFDPMHNAVDHYYAVNGSLKDSWKGLDPDVGVVNWNGDLKGKNCGFFASLGLRQILSGYYDSDEDGSAIAEWKRNTQNVRGIAGAMYTTWENKYDALPTWARRAWGSP